MSDALRIARETFADRAYDDSSYLLSRKLEGAVIYDAELAAHRGLEMLVTRSTRTVSGNRLPVQIDSICIHCDSPA